MLAYQLSLHRAEFFFQRTIRRNGMIQHEKSYSMPACRSLFQNFILVFIGNGKPRVVLCHSVKHIAAFADINNISVQEDSINPSFFKLRRKPFPFQGVIHSLLKIQTAHTFLLVVRSLSIGILRHNAEIHRD